MTRRVNPAASASGHATIGRMRRRDVLGLLFAAALAVPGSALAQATPKIGVLIAQSPPHPFPEVFIEALRALGYEPGEDVEVEVRYGEGRFDRAVELAEELVGLGVDIIVAHHTPAVKAAMNATATIPIVMAPAGAPLQCRRRCSPRPTS